MKKLLTSALLVLCCAACGLPDEVRELKALHTALADKYHFSDITINMTNGSTLLISVINSPYNDSPAAARQRLADDIGATCREKCRNTHPKNGKVAFVAGGGKGMFTTGKSDMYDMHL